MYFETTKQGQSLGAADVVDGDDVRVVEAGDGAGFGQVGFGVFGAVHQLAVRHLDGDEPLQLVVVGQVDEAEAALAQDPLDAVATDPVRLFSGHTLILRDRLPLVILRQRLGIQFAHVGVGSLNKAGRRQNSIELLQILSRPTLEITRRPRFNRENPRQANGLQQTRSADLYRTRRR